MSIFSEEQAMTNQVIMFPGQGIQSRGMGGALFRQFPDLTLQASDILGYDLEDLCLKGPEQKLIRTQFAQPAIYVVNALAYYQMVAEKKSGSDVVAFGLGHSLGEYNALLAADAFDFQTGLNLVRRRGELMGAAAGGGMAAIIGMTPEKILVCLKENSLHDICLANYNTPDQSVISGPLDGLNRAVSILKQEARAAIPLKVNAAFHSGYMKEASEAFRDFLSQFRFQKPRFPVISNLTARPYEPDQMERLLAGQIRGAVMWTDSIRYLMGRREPLEFVEVNGTVLTPMVHNIRQQCTPITDGPIKGLGGSFLQHPLIPSGHGEGDGVRSGGARSSPDHQKRGQSEDLNPVRPSSDVRKDITVHDLGNPGFKKAYGLDYAYLTGGMFRGIASRALVVAMGRAGMMGFFGTGGLPLDEIERNITWIQAQLTEGQTYGMNLLSNFYHQRMEEETVELYLKYHIRFVEAAAFIQISPALVRYRLAGLRRDKDGAVVCDNHIMAKCSRPEVVEQFMKPAPERIVQKLLKDGKITRAQAEMAQEVPMSNEICVEADSGGHTDMGIPTVLLPAMLVLKHRIEEKYQYNSPVFMGLAGGIGSPQAALAAFIMGADFILTGSINQCTVEAGISDTVKNMLQGMNIQDTEYAPAGDMFEMGARVQVLKRGVFFPGRANRLYQLYTQYGAMEEIPQKTAQQIQERYFRRSFADVWHETKAYWTDRNMPQEIRKAQENPKHKMALVFRWYFAHSIRLALSGDPDYQVDYQVHTGPALGVFNQWVKGTELENWRNRHVDRIAMKLLTETAKLLQGSLHKYSF